MSRTYSTAIYVSSEMLAKVDLGTHLLLYECCLMLLFISADGTYKLLNYIC
jgi:hypothetical protein